MSDKVSAILKRYESSNIGIKTNLFRVLQHGALGGTGKIVVLPVDQGFEHGPDQSFAMNPDAYNPSYHYMLSIEAGVSAYASTIGMLEMCADTFVGRIPTILKLNSANSMTNKTATCPRQSTTSSVRNAVQLGCVGVGYTIYPGSDSIHDMIYELKDIVQEAASFGMFVMVWSYARGSGISKSGESAVDIVSYAAHIAASLGAHIIKVKTPSADIEQRDVGRAFAENDVQYSTLAERISIVKRSCMNKMVVFSGGKVKSEPEIMEEVHQIMQGGGDGSIIGRNVFQRKRDSAIKLLGSIMNVYAGNVV